MKRFHTATIATMIAALAAPLAHAGDGLLPSTVPGSPPGFNYPLSYDSTTADPKNHRVIYEDKNVRTLEVTLWPNDQEIVHGHAYPSFFISDEPQPKMQNVGIDKYGREPPPFGFVQSPDGAPPYPHCMTLGPQAPHAATIIDTYPQHFWRMEFKHLDPRSFDEHWRIEFPEFTATATPAPAPAKGPPFTDAWPYPIGDETVRAAPANFVQRYDDGHLRILEVFIRPGETTPVFGSPYYAVEGFDTILPGQPGGSVLNIQPADPKSPLLAHMNLGVSGKPKGLDGPVCRIVGPMPPMRVTNTSSVPAHYYRFELLRVDGDRFSTDWRSMYPVMAEGPKGK